MNNISIMIVIALLAMIGGGFIVCLLWRLYSNFEMRISTLEAQQPKRHTHRTVAGIEDAIAVAIDLVFQADAEKARVGQLLEILQILRQGPHSYDPEREAGQRKE